jgi:hypothetical protein
VAIREQEDGRGSRRGRRWGKGGGTRKQRGIGEREGGNREVDQL